MLGKATENDTTIPSMSGDMLWALEATTDNVILVDREFRITFINHATARLNGITPDSVVGRSLWEVWPGNLGNDIEKNYRRAMAENVAVRFVHGYVEAGRFDLWLEIHACPSPDGLAIFFHDVSDDRRQALREAEDTERLESAIRATDLGVWRCNLPLDDHPFYWSPQVRHHFGIGMDERVGVKEFLDLLHPEDRSPTAEAMARAIDDRVPYDVVYRTIGRDGKTRWIRATGNAFYRADGTPYRFDGFTVELTERIETERELRQAKARLDATLASADDGTWVLDVQTGRINGDANLVRLFGMTEAEARGAVAADYLARIHPDDRDAVNIALAEALRSGTTYDAEYRVLANGQERWLVARGRVERDESGGIVRLPGVVVDITAQKEALARESAAIEILKSRERQQRLRIKLVDALRGEGDADAIARIASRLIGRFLQGCRSTYAMIDPSTKTMELHSSWVDGVEPLEGRHTYAEFGQAMMHAFAQGQPILVENARIDPHTRDYFETVYGPLSIVSFLAVPVLRDGLTVGIFSVQDRQPRRWTDEEKALLEDFAMRAWDAIERARAEADLRALNVSLDEIVKDRTAELTLAYEEAEAFNYSIAHDLRAPLRAIHATSRILEDELDDTLEPEYRAMLVRQSHNAKRLGELIDALLGLSRLARQPLERRQIDLTALAHEMIDLVRTSFPQSGCTFEVQDGLTAHADPNLVRLVLQNLLENACKFSPGGGTVRIGGDAKVFWVRDQGVGFDMTFAPKIFLPFERLVRDNEFPGTGIGLANVERIVKRHGGRIWAESQPGKGATFSFTLGA